MAGKSRSWTPERRAKQAEWMRQNKPWLKSTGPRTPAGKEAVKHNALKHGYRSEDYAELIALLREQEKFRRCVEKIALMQMERCRYPAAESRSDPDSGLP